MSLLEKILWFGASIWTKPRKLTNAMGAPPTNRWSFRIQTQDDYSTEHQ